MSPASRCRGAGRLAHNDEIVLGLPGGTIRVPASIVERIEQLEYAVPVPLSPKGVVGLAELRGRPLTLLDPGIFEPSLAGAGPEGALSGASALLLASPFEHLALLLPAGTTLSSEAGACPTLIDGRRLREWLDATEPAGAFR